MFGEGGTWPPYEEPQYCDVCGRRKHPGQCAGGHLSPDSRTIDHIPAEKPAPVPIQPRGSKRNRLGLTENRQKKSQDEDRRG